VAFVRPAEADDAAAIARVHVASWRATYAGILPDHVLVGLDASIHENRWWRHALRRRATRHCVFVAEDETAGVVGFASGGPARDAALAFSCEIYALYLQDDFHGQGIGRTMFICLSERLADRHGSSLIVWALSENPSRFFYQALGGRLVARRNGKLGGVAIEEFGYGWEDVSAVIAAGGS
jgi:GNAT superfamily N-acetyltransferase